MSSIGLNVKPLYAEIFYYEDRWGRHCARIDAGGRRSEIGPCDDTIALFAAVMHELAHAKAALEEA